MATGANLSVDLEAPSQRPAFKGAEHAREAPVLLGHLRSLGGASGGGDTQKRDGSDRDQQLVHWRAHSAASLTFVPMPPCVTAALMLVGGVLVFSNLPSSGMMIRKWAK